METFNQQTFDDFLKFLIYKLFRYILCRKKNPFSECKKLLKKCVILRYTKQITILGYSTSKWTLTDMSLHKNDGYTFMNYP